MHRSAFWSALFALAVFADYHEPSAATGKPLYLPIEAKAEQRSETVVLRGSLPRAGLMLEATLTGDKQCIRVDGLVHDTTGNDRAVAVQFRLPLDALGWTWHLDSEEHQTRRCGGNTPPHLPLRSRDGRWAAGFQPVPTSEVLKKLIYGGQGRIRYKGDTKPLPPHSPKNPTDQPGWALNFYVNEDPEVSDFVARGSRARLEQYAEDPTRQPFDACLTSDGIGNSGAGVRLNYRREHFRTTLLPLTFGKSDFKVAMVDILWDFQRKCWWPLSNEYKILTYGNAGTYARPWGMALVDIQMLEWDWDRANPGRVERHARSIAHHKILRFCTVQAHEKPSEPAVQAHFARWIPYAVYPALYIMGDRADQCRYLFRQYVPAALLGIEVRGDRVVEGKAGAQLAALTWEFQYAKEAPQDVRLCVRSPWETIERECRVSASAGAAPRQLQVTATLPAQPPRTLLPYLLMVEGKSDDVPFTVAVPLDVKLTSGATAGAIP